MGATEAGAEPAESESDREMGVGPATAREDLLRRLYEKHRSALYRYLLGLTCGDSREAEDVLQETLLRAWRCMVDRPHEVTILRPWLFTVARRIVIDTVRARHARPTEVMVDEMASLPVPAVEDDVDRMLVAQEVRGGLRRLSKAHRRVIFESFYNGRTSRETAELLGISEGTVKSRTHYAIRALATMMAAG